MTNNDLINLYNALEIGIKQGSAKFRYGIKKNLQIISPEIKKFIEIEQNINDTIKDFKNDLEIIYQKYGTLKDNVYTIDKFINSNDINPLYDIAIEEIKQVEKNHNNSISLYNEKQKELTCLLEKDTINFSFFNIDISLVPDSYIELDILMDFNIII